MRISFLLSLACFISFSLFGQSAKMMKSGPTSANSEKEFEAEYQKNIRKSKINGIYIPKNLEECFEQINFYWTDSLKSEVENMTEDDFTAKAHFGFGRWMRNNWGLWGGSRLRTYFNKIEIYHPDDMSGIILDSYHRYLNKKEIKLEKQIIFYQDYWSKVKEKEKKNRKWWKFRKNKN